MKIDADWVISGVGPKDATGRIPFYRTHPVYSFTDILSSPIDISRESMLKKITDEKKHVMTVFRNEKGQWEQGEDVRVTSKKYLRTDPNDTEEDNLGDLPVVPRKNSNL